MRVVKIFIPVIALLIIYSELNAGAFSEQEHFLSDPEPVDSLVVENPLDFCSDLFGRDMRDFELPRAYENNYRFNCRQPLIDQVANNPLYLKQWTEQWAEDLIERHSRGEKLYLEKVLELLDGAGINIPAFEIGTELVTKQLVFKDTLATTAFSAEFRTALENLFGSCLLINSFRKKAIGALSRSDLVFLRDNPAYFLLPDGKKIPDLTGDNSQQQKYIEIVRKIDYRYIFAASILLEKAIGKYTTAVSGLEEKDYYDSGSPGSRIFHYEAEFGRFFIADHSNDIHKEDAAVLIDLGGNDIYKNNSGSNYPGMSFFSFLIDHKGNDIYSARENRYVQGFGFLGPGFLYDLEGNDRYNASHFSQGSGICGVGLLWDRQGDDAYYCNAFCQGAGMFGTGLLLDDEGHDKYDCATLGQGAATTMGLGILSDLSGNDRYLLSAGLMNDALGILPGYGQGGALSFRNYPWHRKFTAYGGTGLLLERSGDDTYKTGGWCDQGGSYIMSLGALYDQDGNDNYSCRVGQGSGIHITNAILIDKNGDDIYQGKFRAGGSGGDRSPGIFLDYAGNDEYYSATSSYGTGVKPYSYSLFVDFKGDDLYKCPEPEGPITFNNWDSFGGVWPESEVHLWPYAMCFDLNGQDDYQVRNRKNDSYRHSFAHGLHIDMTWPDSLLLFDRIDPPLPDYGKFKIRWDNPDDNRIPLLETLQDSSLFTRFQTKGEISGQDPSMVELICEALIKSDHRQFNRDLIECLHYFYINNKIIPDHYPHLIGLLQSRDPEVRTISARDLSEWKIKTASKGLWLTLMRDSVESVRRYTLAALRHMKIDIDPGSLLNLALTDSTAGVRRNALYHLAENTNDFQLYFSRSDRFINDIDPSVRIAFIRGITIMKKKDLVPAEMKADVLRFLYYYSDQFSYDAYLQRAIGECLAWFLEPEGIDILIASLSFPSIDAFENYNRNVPNLISALSNHDLPESLRYDQKAWQDWFESNRDSLDLKLNLTMLTELEKLEIRIDPGNPDTSIRLYEQFLDRYPGNVRAVKKLAALFNSEAWHKVTAPVDSPERDPDLGLFYALRAVELDNSLNHLDTLAEAYLASGLVEESKALCESVLEIYPDNEMFLERIEQLE